MIIYTVICRDSDGAVLVEHTSGVVEGNFPQITRELITCLVNNPGSIPPGGKKTFVHKCKFGDIEDNYLNMVAVEDKMSMVFKSVGMAACFAPCYDDDPGDEDDLDVFYHALHGENLICICLSDDILGRNQNVNFSYLEDARDEFTKRFSSKKIKKANAYGMEKSFSVDLRKLSHYYNSNQKTMSESIKVAKLVSEVDDLKNVMGQNIQLMLNRGENLDKLADQSDALVEETMVFKKRTKEAKNKMKRKNMKTCLVLGGVAVLSIYLVTASFCGFTFSKCMKSS